jgi:uncharacterized damage-inducible protein DinB
MPQKARAKTGNGRPTRTTKAKKSSAASKSSNLPSQKQHFLDAFQREHATTMKLLNAFPPDQSEIRPHPRSKNARELAFTFIVEQTIMMKALQNQLTLGGTFPETPKDYRQIVEQFDKDYQQLLALVKKTPESDFGTTVKFPSGPGQLADYPKLGFVWFMLSDQIHHRGQLSVYLRMAGGKVPSIYGPSADEPWR